MVKVALLGVATIFCALLFKNGKSEYALCISICGCILIFSYGISKLSGVVRLVEQIKAYMGEGAAYFPLLLKMVGITYLAEFASSLCKDAGYSAVGGQVELAGKLSIMAISMPVLSALLETIEGFLP